MLCKHCNKTCVKNGFQTNGKQRYFCKSCKLSFQETYNYKAYKASTNKSIYKLVINSCGISDISRILKISRNTISKRILNISRAIKTPLFNEQQQYYEIDELYAKLNNKQCWITYAINRATKKVIHFVVGKKTNLNISKVINAVLILNPKKIFTDKLKSYVTLVPKHIHNNYRFQTNKIERFNLNLRTHLKRLSRKTLCYSKNLKMLEAIIKIYFWGGSLKFI